MESLVKTMKLFFHPFHRPWKSIMPISTFPRHDYDEDEYLLKPAGLRDTHSEGKVTTRIWSFGVIETFTPMSPC